MNLQHNYLPKNKGGLPARAIVAVHCAIMMLCGCTQAQLNPKPGSSQSKDAASIGDGGNPLNQDMIKAIKSERKQSLMDARTQLRNQFRLKPDRRFVRAFAIVDRFFSGRAIEPVAMEWNGTKWILAYRGETAASVSEKVRFSELEDALLAWTKSCRKRCGFKLQKDMRSGAKIDVDREHSSMRTLMETAGKLENELSWNGATPGLMKDIADLATIICFRARDNAGVADDLYSTSLAAVALAHVTTGDAQLRNRCLNAISLGYGKEIASLAGGLPHADPIYKYIHQELPADGSFAAATGRLLLARRLSQSIDRAELIKAASDIAKKDSTLLLPLLGYLLDNAAPETLVGIGNSVLSTVLAELRGKKNEVNIEELAWTRSKVSDSTEWMLDDLGDELEAGLAGVSSPNTESEATRFFSADLFRSYYRAYWLSAVYALTSAYLELPSHAEISERLARSFRSSNPTYDCAGWIRCREDWRNARREEIDLQADIIRFKTLGTSAGAAFFLDCRGRYREQATPVLHHRAAAVLFSQSDSRPASRLILASVCEYSTLYFRAARRLYTSAAETTADYGSDQRYFRSAVSVDLAQMVVEEQARKGGILAAARKAGLPMDGLHNLSSLRLASPRERLSMLPALAETFPEAEIVAQYRDLVRASGDEWFAVAALCRFLVDRKHVLEARSEVSRWLKAHENKGVERSQAVAFLAECLLRLHDYKGANECLAGSLNDEDIDCLKVKAVATQLSGNPDEAQSWCKEILKRKPDRCLPWVLMASLYWANDNYRYAAMTLSRARMSNKEWRVYVAPIFCRLYGKTEEKAYLAVKALSEQNLSGPSQLAELARGIRSEGRPDLAFHVVMATAVTKEQMPQKLAVAYSYRRDWKGAEEAATWIKNATIAEDRDVIAMRGFSHQDAQLLWAGASERDADIVWMMRACTPFIAQRYKVSDADARLLKKKIDSLGSAERQLVNYVTTGNGKDGLFQAALSHEQLREFALFVGLADLHRRIVVPNEPPESRQNFLEASEWLYLAAISNDTPMQGDLAWSLLCRLRFSLDGQLISFQRVTVNEMLVFESKEKPKKVSSSDSTWWEWLLSQSAWGMI